MSTDLLDLKELVDGQIDPYATVNEALRQIEGRTIRVLSRTTDAQPGSPSAGDTYIITGSATGAAWGGFGEHDIAHYYGGSWKAYTPIEGLRLWVNDEDVTVAFDGTSWVAQGGDTETVHDLGDISGSTDLDLSAGTYIVATLTDDVTFTFSNLPASGEALGFSLELTEGGGSPAYEITWPASVQWPASTVQQPTAAGTDLYSLVAVGSARVIAARAVEDMG